MVQFAELLTTSSYRSGSGILVIPSTNVWLWTFKAAGKNKHTYRNGTLCRPVGKSEYDKKKITSCRPVWKTYTSENVFLFILQDMRQSY